MFPSQDLARVIQNAQLIALRALVHLLRARVNKNTQHLYDAASERLNQAIAEWIESKKRGTPYFSLVADQEKHLRALELENIWETTARYGNTERKRIRSERNGVVGPLNRLLNIVGARMRDYSVLMWPLDTPVAIGRKKTRTIWGYLGDGHTGPVPVSHGADLPELDLVDMIRSHLRELSRKGFVMGMNPRDVEKHAVLLIRRLAPFVDHVYTHGTGGQREFKRPRHSEHDSPAQKQCADRILRATADEMEALYHASPSRRPKPSQSPPKRQQRIRARFFQQQIAELRSLAEANPPAESQNLLVWAD